MSMVTRTSARQSCSHVRGRRRPTGGLFGFHQIALGVGRDKTVLTLVRHYSLDTRVMKNLAKPRVLPACGGLRMLMQNVTPLSELNSIEAYHKVEVPPSLFDGLSNTFRVPFRVIGIRVQLAKAGAWRRANDPCRAMGVNQFPGQPPVLCEVKVPG